MLAKELMEQIFSVHGVPRVVHADRGTSMTSKQHSDVVEAQVFADSRQGPAEVAEVDGVVDLVG